VRSYRSGLTTLILTVCLLGTAFAAADDQTRSSTADSSFSGHDNDRNTLADSASVISCGASGPDRDESGSGRPGRTNEELWSERNAIRTLDERRKIARIRSWRLSGLSTSQPLAERDQKEDRHRYARRSKGARLVLYLWILTVTAHKWPQ